MLIQIYPAFHQANNSSRMQRTSFAYLDAVPNSKVIWFGMSNEKDSFDSIQQKIEIVNLYVSSSWYKIPIIGRFLSQINWYFRIKQYLRQKSIKQAAIIQSNSISDLIISYLISKKLGAKLFYDAHELETERNELKGIHQMIDKKIENNYIHKADEVFVVSPSILKWYKDSYRVEHITLIRNLPEFSKNAVSNEVRDIRTSLNLQEDTLLFIYLGMLSNGRGIDAIIDAFKSFPQKHIAFIGYGPLASKIREAAGTNANIHFIDAIAPKDIQSFIRSADIGISLIENTCLSYYYCMPNKMWEYLNSCIPIIVSDFPDMGDFVKSHQVGWAVNPNSEGLKALIKEIDRESVLKTKASILQSAIPTWNDDKIILTKIYELACK